MANRTVSVNLVANIGQYVSGMNAAAGATMRLGDTAAASSKKAQSGFDLAAKGGLLAGAAVVGGLALAVSKSMEFEKAMSGAAAATRAGGAALDDLRGAAMKAGADTQYSATEAAEAITEMGKAGVSTGDILSGGLTGALSLAAAGQLDVAKAAEIASVAMTQFKLEGDNLPHVADLLAAGAGKAMGSVEDLGMALNQAGLVASSTGLSIEETTGTLAAFASAGLIGSDAGTSFRSMLQHLQNPSKESAEKMAELGIAMYDTQGQFVGMESLAGQLQAKMQDLTPAVRDAAMAQIFGSDAVRAANVLYAEGSSGIADWTAKVNDAGYAAEQAAKLNDNLAGDLERLGGSFDTLMISLGSGAQGPLREIVQMLGGLVDGITWAITAFSDLPGPVQMTATAFAALALLNGPLTGLLTTIHEKSVMGAVGLLDFATSADKARAGLASMALAATELAIAWSVGKAVKDVVEFTQAGDDARVMVDRLKDSLGGLAEGPAKTQAQTTAIKELRDELGQYQSIVNEFESYNGLEWTVYGQFVMDADEVANARDSIATIEAEIARLQGKSDEASVAIDGMVWSAGNVDAGGWGAKMGAMAVSTAVATQQTEAAATAQSELGQSLADFVEPLGAYTGLLEEKKEADRLAAEATAASTTSSADSWRDYGTDVGVTFDEYMARLEEQVVAQANWQTNMLLLAGRVSQGTLDELSRMGPEGAPLVADLVNRSDAELDRFDEITAMRSQEATDAWGAQLTQAAPVLAAVAGMAGQGVADELARQLAAGTTNVAAIAAQYGIEIANGINPILEGLGKPRVRPPNNGSAMKDLWGGGYTGDGGKYQPMGVVHGGEYVLTKEQTTRLGINRIEAFANRGYASGGFVTAADVPRPYSTAPYGVPISTPGDASMEKGFAEVTAWLTANAGTAGNGTVGGDWQSIWNWVKARIPQATQNSTYRAGDPGYHGKGKAIDFGFGGVPGGNGSAGLALINRTLHDGLGANLAELIYDGLGDDRPDLKNGKPLTYNAATRAQHHNHVHAATYDQGGWLQPGYTMAYNGTGAPERVLTSREFGGSGGGRAGSGSAAAPQVTVQFFVDGQEFRGMARAEVEHKLGEVADRVMYAGG